jgi:hypothetical protein
LKKIAFAALAVLGIALGAVNFAAPVVVPVKLV